MILFHIFTPGWNDQGQLGCREFLKQAEPELSARGWRIEHREASISDPNAYEDHLVSLWGQDDLIGLEQDIVPTIPMLLSLAECPHSFCVQAYGSESGGRRNYIQMKEPATGSWVEIEKGDEYCDIAGLGLVKISLKTQKKFPARCWGGEGWNTLDIRLQLHIYRYYLPQYRFTGDARSTVMVIPPQEVSPGDIVKTRSVVNSPVLEKLTEQGPRWHVHWPKVRHDH